MTPNQKPAACAWPGCELRPSGPFCGRDRKRVLALGFSARRAEMPDEETLRRLPEMWQQHVAQSDARAPAPVVEAPAVEPGAADHPMRVTGPEVAANWAVRDMLGDHPDRELRDLSEILDGEGFPIPLCDRSPNCVSLHLRIRLHTLLDERNNLRKEREDIAAALGPKFMPADSSVANAVQNLHRYVRGVEEEGGRYALLCQQAHDELDRVGVRTEGTPAERIRLLVAADVTALCRLTAERDQFRTAKFERDNEVRELEREIARRDREATRPAAPTEAPRSTELEQYLARQLLAELEDNFDKDDPILRPLNMLRAIVTGEVPRG